MSFKNGMAAINLEMTDFVPRTEYSAEFHWDLIKRVTGITAGEDDPDDVREAASAAFVKAWDYGMYWNILTHNQIFGDKRTDMGHAAYHAGGTDFSATTSSLFDDPEDVYDFDMFATYGVRDRATLCAEYDADYDSVHELLLSVSGMLQKADTKALTSFLDEHRPIEWLNCI